jgi:hypothetical protein
MERPYPSFSSVDGIFAFGKLLGLLRKDAEPHFESFPLIAS